MKCPSCGADTSGRFCEYCGSELPYSGPQVQNTYNTENVTHHVTNVYYVNTPDTNYSPARAVQQPFPQQPDYQAVPFSSGPQVSGKNKSAALLFSGLSRCASLLRRQMEKRAAVSPDRRDLRDWLADRYFRDRGKQIQRFKGSAPYRQIKRRMADHPDLYRSVCLLRLI